MNHEQRVCGGDTAHRVLPTGACDAHAHIFGPLAEYPYAEPRLYTPPEALELEYQEMLRSIGFDRAVLVQPSVYGTDNKRMLDLLRHAPKGDPIDWRGVIVIDTLPSDEQLEEWHHLGVRGIRVNLLHPGGLDLTVARQLSSRLLELGWHFQFMMNVSSFESLYRCFEGIDRGGPEGLDRD